MKVWIVMEQHPGYDGGDSIVSIHATQEGAEREAARLTKIQERVSKLRGELLEDEERYAKEPWPEMPKGVPESGDITAMGPWTVRAR